MHNKSSLFTPKVLLAKLTHFSIKIIWLFPAIVRVSDILQRKYQTLTPKENPLFRQAVTSCRITLQTLDFSSIKLDSILET